jgi:N-hydroxyarylamine O-acetyltransferase
MNTMHPDRIDSYLSRLGSPAVRRDADGLARLQAAHLMAVPFHNLLLLANDGRPWALPSLNDVVDEAIAGVGGNCDRTTPPFAALLDALGFEVHLAAATVRAPGDHLVCVVRVDGRRFLCDVGNGHPYLRPWELDGPAQEQAFHGWRFRFDPAARGGPTLLRRLPDGAMKVVYALDGRPRAYADFAPMVTAHYTQAGFGPFLGGLRAVSIQPEAVLTLRDGEYARDTRFGRSLRQVAGHDGILALLVERFGLPPRLVGSALEAQARRRPELLSEPRWFALGCGRAEDSVGVAPPGRDAVPDVLVSLATVGRVASVRRLLDSLADEVRASGYPGRVGVLIVENHDPAAAVAGPDPLGLTVHRFPIAGARPALDRAVEAGLLPPVGDRLPLPIGAAREAQLAALRAHLDAPMGGLPHPADHPLVVWMVDDDVAFQQLDPLGRIGHHTHLLFRAARLWSQLPQRAVVLGTFTGDPPIPGLDTLGGQLHDLAENLSQMLALGPDAAWQPSAAPPPTFDAYYDLTEAPGAAADAVWPYAPHRAGARVRGVARALLDDLPRLVDGQQLTRSLVWDGTEAAPRPSLRRGGNTLFLDLDALFRWPTPVLAMADGVQTRRADTVWAALAQAEDPGAVVEATLPLLHGREGQADQPGRVRPDQAGQQAAAQLRGVVLSRAVSEGRDVAVELARREARVTAHRRGLRARLGVLRAQVSQLAVWQDGALEGAIVEALRVLDALERLVSAAEPLPGDPLPLSAFVAGLPDAVRAWRGGW